MKAAETPPSGDEEDQKMLRFSTGATRNRKEDELAFEGFISPLVLLSFARYMHKHRFTADGTVRDPDNWQKGMPVESYMDSMIRHVVDLWLIHRGYLKLARESQLDAANGVLFNIQGIILNLMELQEAHNHD
jgi:hypothetical protein